MQDAVWIWRQDGQSVNMNVFLKNFKIVLRWGQSLEKIGQIWLQLNYDKRKEIILMVTLLQIDINV
jgi:hypothetical protein